MVDSKNIRISSAEARLKISKLSALGITGFNCMGIAFSVYTLLTLNAILDARSGADLLQQTRDDFAVYETMEREARDNLAIIRQMDGSVDLDISQKNILATASVLQKNEQDFQLFYRLLKVNLYHLTGEIPGSSSWFENYGPEIDLAIERSRSRQLLLLQIQERYEEAA